MTKITKELSEQIQNLYLDKTSVPKIAKIVSLGPTTVRSHLIELGMYKSPNAKYAQNDLFFSNIDCEKKAYWLGVLYADGCVRCSSIVVFSSKDKDWVEQFKRDLDTDRPIYREFHKKYQKEIWKLTINSCKMAEDLKNLGCVERKSKIIRMPDIRKDLICHFIRGYFDGDGTACFSFATKQAKHRTLRTSFCSGSKLFLEDLVNEIPVETKPTVGWHDNGTGGGVWDFSLGPHNSLVLYDYFYNNATVFLKRKKDVFELYKNVKYILSEWDSYNDDEQVFILQHARETLKDYNQLPNRVKE